MHSEHESLHPFYPMDALSTFKRIYLPKNIYHASASYLICKVVGNAEGVLILEYEGRRDYVNADKILAAWEL